MTATLLLQAFDDEIALQLGIQLAVGVVFGIVCAAMASGRGRSTVGWFFLGFLLNCVGLIILLLIPNPKLEEEKQRRRDAETRRLREQLKKDRQVADERHVSHRARLGAHDRALGLDTASTSESGPRLAPPPLPNSGKDPVLWFYSFDNERHGPVPGAEVRQLWLDEHIPDSTLVWCDGMSDWRPIGEVADLLEDDRG